MSVRQSLLAILDQGACYGYQLRAEFDRRTGSTWPLNVGQIYNTLDRLERDGLVVRGETDEHGHVYYEITDAGSADVAAWLSTPVVRDAGTRDELAVKLAVAATLPGIDLAALIQDERRALIERLERLAAADADPEGLAEALIVDSMICRAEAEVRWLDRAQERVARHPHHSLTIALASERPRRGRPVKGSTARRDGTGATQA